MANLAKLCTKLAKLSANKPLAHGTLTRSISQSPKLCDLMEFFDDKKNWGVDEVKSGRSWKLEELRLKSNTDLHKLWYVLLKERNMLLTMEHESNAETRLFPSPERLDKVAESMENLEAVGRERNKAYHELETGENAERPGVMTKSHFGLDTYYQMSEYPIPKSMNEEWKERNVFPKCEKTVRDFLRKYKEKQNLEKRRAKTRDFNHVCGLFKRFPDMDIEAVKEQYPDVDIEKARRSRRSEGHYVPR